MSRRIIAFPCEGATLFGTLDLPEGKAPTAGLLIVSGGNEIRTGAWGSHARIAAAAAAQGYAALRFDRRGIGESEGENTGFTHSAPDIAAALTAFRAEIPSLTRITAHGNCDAASALMLMAGEGADALVISNPWTFEEDNAAPSVTALREHYKKRLLNWSALRRLLTGQVAISGLVKSLLKLTQPAPPPSTLATKMADGLAQFAGPVQLLIAGSDNTGQAFLGTWDAKDPRIALCKGASHSFVEGYAREWLVERILVALKG